MNSKMQRYRKPNLMVLLSFFVGLGVLVSSLAQAAEPVPAAGAAGPDAQRSVPEQWLRAVWGLDLAGKLRSWKPRTRVDSDGEGVRLSHPFGNHGPALRLSTSIPERAQLSLRAGGDNRVGSLGSDAPGPYLFLHKRW